MTRSTAYTGATDLSAMQAALASWLQQDSDYGFIHVGDIPHRIYNGLRGRYPRDEMIRIWREGDTVQAFAIVYPSMNGYDALASPAIRGGAIERDMLEWAYTVSRQWMNTEDKQAKPVITDVSDTDAIRAELLTELGYVPEDQPWLYLNTRSLLTELPTPSLPAGFHIRGATGEADAEQLAAVHHGAFGSAWTPEIYRDEVMRKPGYRAELERVVVAPNGEFAAFCVLWLDAVNQIGLFEPVGTHERYQRQGLGRALLTDSLRFLRDHGMITAHVGSEATNPASNNLYQAVGFSKQYELTGYQKP